MLSGNEGNMIMQAFHAIDGMPAILANTDCAHIAISRPHLNCIEIEKDISYQMFMQLEHAVIQHRHESAHDSFTLDQSCLHQELEEGHSLGNKYLLTPILNPRNDQERRYI